MSKRLARRRRRAIVIGAFVIAGGLALSVLALVSQHGVPFAARTQLRAAFVDVGSLRNGDDVRIANVRVGYVQNIELVKSQNPVSGSSTQPVATILLDNERPVYNNAQAITASVGARSALGQKFIELNPGDVSAGLLPKDALIPATETSGAQELSDVLAVLDLPTRQSIGSTVRNVGGGLAGHGADLNAAFNAAPDVLPDLGVVSDALSINNGRDFASLLRSTNELSLSFAGRQQQIGQLLGKLDKTFGALNADNGQALAATLQTAPEALRKARGALQSLDAPLADTAVAARDLRPGAESLGRATPDVRGVFREGKPPLDKVPGVSDDARPALSDLRDVASDARPLAPMLTKTFGRGGNLAQSIAPFSPEAELFFTNATDALKNGNDNYRWLRFVPLAPTAENGDGALPFRDPLQSRDPYPAPGGAAQQRQQIPGVGGVLGR